MRRFILIVQTNPVSADREEEFNEWYSGVHIEQVLQVDGFVAATRYRVAPAQMGGLAKASAHRYAAVYEIEAEDSAIPMKSLGEAVAGGMVVSDALDRETVSAVLFEEIKPHFFPGALP
jgi:hypothetical protein